MLPVKKSKQKSNQNKNMARMLEVGGGGARVQGGMNPGLLTNKLRMEMSERINAVER